MTVISYPIPPNQNEPIKAEYYQPSRFVISGITRGKETIITTTEDMNYVIGQQVRIILPSIYKCYQINQQTGYVLSIPTSKSVTIDIDSSSYDPFVNTAYSVEKPQIVAIGTLRNGSLNSEGRINNINYTPGAFINISPQ